jgi:Ser/Thr protein kinase RdoA (MazF antagonist)
MTGGQTFEIGQLLDCMAIGRAATRHELIGEGISGSCTYRVWFGDQGALLKVTAPASSPWVLARARRELLFYRVLAGTVPLRVPALLGACDDDQVGICLLLSRYEPPPPAAEWLAEDVAEVARQLAGLHACFWGEGERLAAHAWLRQPEAQTSEQAIRCAREQWAALSRMPRFSSSFTAGTWRALDGAMACVSALDATIGAFPTTLCHGDCHLGNVLRDRSGQLVWADWSEVGLGAGPADLSFLIQRANADGARFSADELSAVYHRQLVEAIGSVVSLDAVRCVIDAQALRTRLLEWPHYLGGASPALLSDMLARIALLAARF